MPEYRDSTTLIVTSDHGRGSNLSDWSGHGGPDTPTAGEISTHAERRDIAPTIIKLMGLNPADYKGAAGASIQSALKP